MSVKRVDHTQEFCEALAMRWTGTALAATPADETKGWRVLKQSAVEADEVYPCPHCRQDMVKRRYSTADMIASMARDATLTLAGDDATRIYAKCTRDEARMETENGAKLFVIYAATMWVPPTAQ